MAIVKYTKLADAVLALLDVILPEGKTFYAEPYQNGRESGWAIFSSVRADVKVVFAEYRRSDELVVYTGTFSEFGNGNTPSDVVYKAKQLWGPSRLWEAAEYIKGYLIS